MSEVRAVRARKRRVGPPGSRPGAGAAVAGATTPAISRPIGRPAAGLNGAAVTGYPQLSVRVPPDVRAFVQAASAVRRCAQWQVVTEAVIQFVVGLPPMTRREVLTRATTHRARR